jgi:hypothetical protein
MGIARTEDYKNGVVACQVQSHMSELNVGPDHRGTV